MNTSFNWKRALEGAVVSGLIAGSSALQVAIADKNIAVQAVSTAFGVTFLVTVIKGFGQAYQDAASVTTTVTQPAGTTTLTETTAAPTPVIPEPPSKEA
jgi:hypothetical protein